MLANLLLCVLAASPSPRPTAPAEAAPSFQSFEEPALAEALELLRTQEFAAAAGALAPTSPDEPTRCKPLLQPWCAYFRGHALLYAGEPLEAARVLEVAGGLDPDGPVAARALALEGQALRSGGALETAVPRLREAVRSRSTPELLSTLAGALWELGEREDAVAHWKRIYVENPEHPAAEQAKARLALAGPLGKLTLEEGLRSSARLLSLGRGEEAVEAARQASKTAGDAGQRAQAQLALGKALLSLKRFEPAEQALSLAKADGPPPVQQEAITQLAKAAMSRGELDRAARLFEELERRFGPRTAAEEAQFLAAWVPFNKGDYPACAQAFRTFLAKRRGARRADEATWYLGYCSYLAGDKAEASKAFVSLERLSAKLAPQALYWRARIEEPKPEAAELYRKVLRTAPTSWYAWLARGRLASLEAEPEPFPLVAAAPATPPPLALREQRAVALARLGLAREAESELSAGETARSEDQAERGAAFAAAIGLHGRAYRLANARLWGSAMEKRRPTALALLYPRAFEGPVQAAAEAVGIDPYFLWAIMRRESAFDPLALSSARAMGLMQLLQPTARKIALLAGDTGVSVESLQTPERIIPLAAWYLADLCGRFGHAALAAAGYNGGPRNVAKWIGDRGARPLDEFVEMIPFKETRLYVKGVLGDYFTYRALWGATGPSLPFGERIPADATGVSF